MLDQLTIGHDEVIGSLRGKHFYWRLTVTDNCGQISMFFSWIGPDGKERSLEEVIYLMAPDFMERFNGAIPKFIESASRINRKENA